MGQQGRPGCPALETGDIRVIVIVAVARLAGAAWPSACFRRGWQTTFLQVKGISHRYEAPDARH